MTIAACPKCSEEVSLPSQASAQARVRCPFCQEEYVLSDVLDSLPPALEVLGDLGGSSQDSGHGSASPGESAINAFAAVAAGDSPSKPAASAFDFHEESAPSAARPSKPGTGARPHRRKRKPKKPVIEVLKIVGGGTLGIIGAILIIWWVIGKDPFKLGPKVASFALTHPP